MRVSEDEWTDTVHEKMWTLMDQNGRVCPGCDRDFRVQPEGVRWHINTECDELRTLAEAEVRDTDGAPTHD